MFLSLPDPDPLVRGTGPDSNPSLFLIKVSSGLKQSLQNKILTQNFCKKFNFNTEENVPAGKL
jgi:hypothetical protein